MSSSPVPLKTRREGERCTLNILKAQTSSQRCGVIVKREGEQVQVSFSSLDYGSKLRGLSKKSLRVAEHTQWDIDIHSLPYMPPEVSTRR
ncbi:hypothetical protein TNCV_1055991 [Trichonephila clavipes]|nr:hypothetical protein TNCV_1055991 [Trichonephila clavipes]